MLRGITSDTLVRDLRDVLWPDAGAGDLSVDGRAVPVEETADGAGVLCGTTLALVPPHEGSAPAALDAGPEPDDRPGLVVTIVAGPAAGASALLSTSLTIGRDASANLVVDDATVSPRHLRLSSHGAEVTIEDLESHNGTAVDGQPVVGVVTVPAGATISAGASRFQVRSRRVADRHQAAASTTGAEGGRLPFNRPPRRQTPSSPAPIGAPKPEPTAGPSHGVPAAALVGPLLTAAAVVAVTGTYRYAVFGVVGPLLFVAQSLYRRHQRARGLRRARERFGADLTRFTEQLTAATSAERRRLEARLPDLAETLRRASLPSTTLWERRSYDEDLLRLRIGSGTRRWEPPVTGPTDNDDLADMIADASLLRGAPIEVDLRAGTVLGLAGDRARALGVARSLICQAAVHHGPSDLAVAVLTNEKRCADWDWAKWLPHVALEDGGVRIAVDPDTAWASSEAAVHQPPPAGTLLLVVDDPELLAGRDGRLRRSLRHEANPVAAVVVAASVDALPAACTLELDLTDDLGSAQLHPVGRDRNERGPVVPVDQLVVDGLTDDAARRCARLLARYEDPDLAGPRQGLPKQVALTDLLDLTAISPGAVSASWDRRAADTQLSTPLGVTADGTWSIDLVEDGPHALVAGTTGAGKSELLRSLVVGLAVRYPPERVTFVLIDYKGGSAFDRCALLPHTVGLATDLDEHLAERALRSLEAELRARESLLRQAGAPDIVTYQREGSRRGPLPRLVVVIDEFATLTNALPTFVGALVAIAQRGRSLGLHLVLATQRPAGSVSGNIRANTNLRIALRVRDHADSIDVIDVADSAAISSARPGRAHVRNGRGELLAVQTAQASMLVGSGEHHELDVTPFTVDSTGERPCRRAPSLSPQVADLEGLVAASVEAFRTSGAPTPRAPWLPPLPARIGLHGLCDLETPSDGAAIGYAVADDPDHQRQFVHCWRLDDGHLAIIGSAGSGTTTAARTVALAAASSCTVDGLHLYLMDFGGGALTALAGLPHVGAVVTPGEPERLVRLLTWLREELDSRRQAHTKSAAERARVVVVVDHIPGVLAELEGTGDPRSAEAFERIMGDGAAVGIHVVVTAPSPLALPLRLSATVTQRVVLHLAEGGDRVHLGGGPRPTIGGRPVPGRGIDPATGVAVQVAGGDDPAALIERIVANVSVPARPPRPVVALPRAVSSLGLRGSRRGGVLRVPLGIDGASFDIVHLDLASGDRLLVAGPARSGVSTTLEHLAHKVRDADPDAVRVAVTQGSSPLSSAGELFDAVGTLHQLEPVLDRAITDRTHRWLVLVDDAHALDNAACLERLSSTRHLIVAVGGRSDLLLGAYGHWARTVARTGRGLLLMARSDVDGELLGARLPRNPIVPMRPGLGYSVGPEPPRLVQVAGADLAARRQRAPDRGA